MENLLRDRYTAHYGLSRCTVPDLVIQTTEIYFEIEDTATREIAIYTSERKGAARFSNRNKLDVTIANYDKFVSSLSPDFQKGRKRCDIIVCDEKKNLILGELKDSPNIIRHRKKAKKQLSESLIDLLAVPEFLELSNNRTVKRCCYFNKRANSPGGITATTAFNRLSIIFQDGFKMNYPAIEGHGFEFWEYLGEQTLTLE